MVLYEFLAWNGMNSGHEPQNKLWNEVWHGMSKLFDMNIGMNIGMDIGMKIEFARSGVRFSSRSLTI